MEKLISCFQGCPKELVTILIAALPISELRGAIPFALGMNIPVFKAYLLAVFGNLIPIVPLLLFFGEIVRILEKSKLGKKFLNWMFARTRSKSQLMQKFEFFGLMIFVAIPLPMTGAWTGTAAAFLFGMRFRYAFLAISLGVIIAGVIVMVVSLGGFQVLKFIR